MADTIADIPLTGAAYQDLYDATGITVGVSVIIQNKSMDRVWIQIKATTPTAASRDGYLLLGGNDKTADSVTIAAGESGCWAFGSGPIGVRAA